MDTTKALAQPCDPTVATATHAICTAQIAAPTNNTNTIYITGYEISANGQPAAAVEATLTGAAAAIPIEIPGAAFAPIIHDFGTHPLRIVAGNTAVLSVPDLGVGIKCAVVLYSYLGTA